MATTTTNLQLVKPDADDWADIAVINSNMDILDSALIDGLATKQPVGDYALKSEIPTSVNGMSGGTITSEVTVQGHLTAQNVYSTWLNTSSATAQTTAEKIAVIQSGWIYYITPDNLKTVLGVPTKLSDLTIDKELGNKVTYSETEPSEPKSGDTWFKIED